MAMENIDGMRRMSERMSAILSMAAPPIGVRLISREHSEPADAEMLGGHRYCQALMKARHGKNVLLKGDGLVCPAAAAAFGFKPLPDGLKSGKGLVGFGIVSDAAVGMRMFEGMSRMSSGSVSAIHLYPLNRAEFIPDVVVVEDEAEKLMWIALAYLHSKGGERVAGSTAVLQATCVDSTIIPFLEQRLNYGLGCYGCRDATDLGASETVLGFPAKDMSKIMEHLEYLNQKAIPHSREKSAFAVLKRNTCPSQGGNPSRSDDCATLGDATA